MVLVENLRKRTHLNKLGLAGRIILKWIIRSGLKRRELDLSGLG
jgi:hypothetical protein